LIVVTGISKPSLRQERQNTTITENNLSQPSAPRYSNLGLSWSNNQQANRYTACQVEFTDANNTAASVNGVTGLLEGYHVFDLATEYKFKKNYNLKAGINNVFNEQYTTRRASVILDQEFTWRRSNILPFSWGKILIRLFI
jgi:outer membrane receptor for ferrienterochelin and colicin